MSKPVIISGMRPTGPLHIGNYLGALKNWVEIQDSNKYNCFFFIADYHSLDKDYDPKAKRQQILELATEYIAAGLDPNKSTIFVQSQVPKCTELAWIFNTITPVSELERMTQFKDKSARQKDNINIGLLGYPVLQSADILLYKGELVPVGEDQVQHIELTRKVARWFNNKYQSTFFPETKPLLTKEARVMSLLSPEDKMAKSSGNKHWIGISESPESILKKVKSAVSTPEGIENLKELYNSFKDDMDGGFNADKMGDTKTIIAEGVANHFSEFRTRKEKLLKNPKEIKDILELGRQKAEAIAKNNIEEVKSIVGVI